MQLPDFSSTADTFNSSNNSTQQVVIGDGLVVVWKVISVEAEGTDPNFGGKVDDGKGVEYGLAIAVDNGKGVEYRSAIAGAEMGVREERDDRFRTLLSLQGSVPSQPDPDSSATFLHSLTSSICPPPPLELGFSLELTSVLLAKDKLNAAGLMEPFSKEREERSVRAYDIYPVAIMDDDVLNVDDTIDEEED
ncbi:hypothetical protein L2E82_47230 [Cichorium intybus]|uniref:Uncharacterized protein n=1 Tax=Cichorium intybus TaxID=13427 RepID=A0ACB8YVH3_CICIN|nr:hypothetical protein L2E82_47230 [Cichorium intybus]